MRVGGGPAARRLLTYKTDELSNCKGVENAMIKSR